MEATYHAKFGVPTMVRLGSVMEWAELGGIILNYEESCNTVSTCHDFMAHVVVRKIDNSFGS